MLSAGSLTLKDRATRSPVRLDEVVVRRKNAVDVILRQHYPHVMTRKLSCQHVGGALKAVVGKCAMTCRKPAVEEKRKQNKIGPAGSKKEEKRYTQRNLLTNTREWSELLLKWVYKGTS